MTFLQPILLYALPLILLPVLIHLLNRLRHRTQQWGAMRFLVAASRSSVNRARLKQFLILLFRTLAVLMLILFLARPLTGGWMGWAFASAPDTVLILLDRSASMETRLAGTPRSRREQAIDLIKSAAEPYQGYSNFVLIESAGSTAQTLAQVDQLDDHPLAASSDTTTDMPSLLQRALQWLNDNQAGTTELWMASDLQRSNWLPSDDRWSSVIQQFEGLPQSVQFRLLAVNEQTETDVSLQLADMALMERASDTRSLRITADLFQSLASGEVLNATRTLNGLGSALKSLRRQTKYAGRIHGIWDQAVTRDGAVWHWLPMATSATILCTLSTVNSALMKPWSSVIHLMKQACLRLRPGRWGRTDGSLPAWKPIDRPVLGNWIGYP